MTDQYFEKLDRLYGKVSPDQFFHGDTKAVPFPPAGGMKFRHPYDPDVVNRAVHQTPPELVDIDPRTLKATQSHVTRGGVLYYAEGHYDRTGETYADKEKPGNRYPVVYSRENPATGRVDNLILAGHHRATAALLKGHPVRAINPRGGFGPDVRDKS